MMDYYNVAKYIRLSIADGDSRESESVENQRDLLDNYLEKSEEFESIYEYVDDGYTGGNFDRPGFKKMLEDIESGKINCVICKDLSRFGRDHIDTGFYLERYFPKKFIRFIAVTDGVDTKDSRGMQFLSFKLSFNDYYIQDISNKIKSVKRKKMEAGEYQAGIPVYGYQKDTKQKNHLVIDEKVAPIVREIFDMCAYKNMSTVQIAYELNERKVTPPGVYLKLPSIKPNREYYWGRSYIGKMLRNETYIGKVVSGQKVQISPKIKKGRRTSKEEYIIVENMHDPIIDIDTWNCVREKMSQYDNNKKKKYNYILDNMVYCGLCGGKIKFQHGRIKRENGIVWEGITSKCTNHKKYGIMCNNKILGENAILNEIKKAISMEIENISYTEDEIKRLYEEIHKKDDFKIKLKVVQDKIKQIDKKIEDIYEKKLYGEIASKDFVKVHNELVKEKEQYELELNSFSSVIDKAESQNNYKKELRQFKKSLKAYLKVIEPDRDLIESLIERIIITNKEITIIFRHKPMVED